MALTAVLLRSLLLVVVVVPAAAGGVSETVARFETELARARGAEWGGRGRESRERLPARVEPPRWRAVRRVDPPGRGTRHWH